MASLKKDQRMWSVQYQGFVFLCGPGGAVPSVAQVKDAYKLLRKPKDLMSKEGRIAFSLNSLV